MLPLRYLNTLLLLFLFYGEGNSLWDIKDYLFPNRQKHLRYYSFSSKDNLFVNSKKLCKRIQNMNRMLLAIVRSKSTFSSLPADSLYPFSTMYIIFADTSNSIKHKYNNLYKYIHMHVCTYRCIHISILHICYVF